MIVVSVDPYVHLSQLLQSCRLVFFADCAEDAGLAAISAPFLVWPLSGVSILSVHSSARCVSQPGGLLGANDKVVPYGTLHDAEYLSSLNG